MIKILVVDDEKIKLITLVDALKMENYDVDSCEDGRTALEKIKKQEYDIVITDLKLPEFDGMEILKEVKKNHPDTEVIIMTAYGTIESAVSAMKIGAHDYITKPFSTDELLLKVGRLVRYKEIIEENKLLHDELEERYKLVNIIGKNKKMQDVYNLINIVAPLDSTVLISGESGTGKELVAHAIHHLSLRKSKPFIRVSCASLPETLLESELFGHEKGAFTGAIYSKKGRFELANTGTIFLDDVDDMSSSVQVKLLRVLQEREFERVGGTETIKVDVRIISASKKDLSIEIKNGKFREDLFYRLNVINIHLPPLRDRKDDIKLLIEQFIKKYSNKTNKKIKGVSENALSLILNYNWPGNVRELENVIERAIILTDGDYIREEHLPGFISQPVSELQEQGFSISQAKSEAEKRQIIKALEESQGKKTEAAKKLGISRKTLWQKVKLYNI